MKSKVNIYKFGLVIAAVIFGALVFAPHAMAQDTTPPDVATVQVVDEVPSPSEPTNPSLPDVAVLIAIVAFMQKRFGLEKAGVMIAAVSVGAVLWFAPMLSTAFPASAYWIDGTLAFIKWILASMGAVDFTIHTGARIATTTKKDLEAGAK